MVLTRDNTIINALINKKIGLIILFPLGVIDRFLHLQKIDFTNTIPEYLPYTVVSINSSQQVTANNLPTYDCDKETWSKMGIYYVESSKDPLFIGIIDTLFRYNEQEIEKSAYEQYQFINNNSRRVIVIDSEGSSLVFYLTKIKNQWYLTMIDRVSDDCSA